jgi:hypothetical protein
MEVRLTPAERKAAQQTEAQRQFISGGKGPEGINGHVDLTFVAPAVLAIYPTRIGPGPDRPEAHADQ